jgi:chemotaxis protein CheX
MTTNDNLVEQVSSFLDTSVCEVFTTMLTMFAQPANPRDFHATGETLVIASVGFTGEPNGVISICVTAAFARTLAARMLGITQEKMDGDEMTNDAIGELSNMIVGSVKSRLCDEGHSCALTIPSVKRVQDFRFTTSNGPNQRILGFQCGEDQILMELLMKSSS